MRFRELQVMSLKGISWWLPERKWKSLSHVQLFATPWTVAHQLLCPWDSPARILEWVAISFSRVPDPGIEPRVSCVADWLFTICATREVPGDSQRGINPPSPLYAVCLTVHEYMQIEILKDLRATSNCSSFTTSVLHPPTWKCRYGPSAQWSLQGQSGHKGVTM